MRHLLGILTVVFVALTASALWAGESTKKAGPAKSTAVEKPAEGERIPDGLEFAPDGLARDVLNLMTGLSHPLDESTNLTVQAGKGLKFGLTF